MLPPPLPRKKHTYCRSERDMNKRTAQRRAISSAQAPLSIIINSIFAPKNRGPLLPAPFTYVSVVSSVRERSGRRQPPAERSPVLFLEPHRTARY